MSSRRQRLWVFAVLCSAGLATSPVFAAPPKNLILFIPEALPALAVDPAHAPALARFRYEGVSFMNSHSGFPRLAAADPFEPSSDLDPQLLIAGATGEYLTAYITEARESAEAEQPAGLRQLTGATLPRFKEAGRPFFLIYHLTEPESTPPAAGTTRPAFKPDPRAADHALEAIETTLKSLGLYDSTNIVIAAQHGFSRVLKLSHTSRARTLLPREDTLGTLPPGFLAVDLVAALQAEDATFNLYDTDHGPSYVDWPSGGHPTRGNALIVANFDPSMPYVTVEAHGAYDTVFLADFLRKEERRSFAEVIVEAVLEQDYLGAVFVNEKRVGAIRGALSMSHITPASAGMRQPDLVIAFASTDDGCAQPILCTSVIADTPLPEGEGVPNSFNRTGTAIFMAARGPDFQSRTISRTPASNADVARTIAALLQLDVELNTRPKGRVLTEALAADRHRSAPKARVQVLASAPSIEGFVTEVRLQSLGAAQYFDAADSTVQRQLAQAEKPRRTWKWPRFKRFTISISDDDY